MYAMSNVEVPVQLVIENLLEQNKKLTLELATLQAAVAGLQKDVDAAQLNGDASTQGEQQ